MRVCVRGCAYCACVHKGVSMREGVCAHAGLCVLACWWGPHNFIASV